MLLASCSGPEKINKYWHAGSERPYTINGVTYYPQIHYQYDAVGYASWYGAECHKKPTATGRTFFKNKVTAAHRTLPLPCIVLVENLANGRKMKVLVNDRGPFAKTNERIIDLSECCAQKLGFLQKGVTKVRVRCIPELSQKAAIVYRRKPYPIRK